MEPPPAHPRYEISCDKKRDGWDYAKAVGELIGLGFLIAYTVFTGLMYCVNKKAADAAKSAAETAASQLELSERPWVDAQILLNGPLTFNINGASIPLKLSLRNTGHSPAMFVAISTLPSVASKTDNAVPYREQACKDATRVSATMPDFGITLFPNVTFEQRYEVGLPKEEIEKGKASKVFPGSRFGDVILSPAVSICMAYRPTFHGTRIYHTAYIVDLFKVDSANHLDVRFKIGEDVDQKHLLLRIHPWSAIYAD
jgi:hypothetical protein